MPALSPILAITDVDKSIQFYTDVLQFELGFRLTDENDKANFAMVKMGEAEILLGVVEGFVDAADHNKRGLGVQIYIELPDDVDIQALHDYAKSKGANIISPVTKRDWGEQVFTLKDPDGYFFMFAETVKPTT